MELVGLIAIELKFAPVIFSGADPEKLGFALNVAVIFTGVPFVGAIPVAVPLAFIVASLVLLELQETSELVSVCVVLSLNVPVARKVCVVLIGIVRPRGVTVTAVIVAVETVNGTEGEKVPNVAVMFAGAELLVSALA